MALSNLAAKAIACCRPINSDSLELIEFGNQRIHLNEKTMIEIQNQLGIESSFQFDYNDRLVPSASRFYQWLGIVRYVAVDVNSKDNAKEMDLNLHFQKYYEYYEQFDVVVNNGTGEHVFNQAVLFENMHNLCKTGGVILNIVPLGPWLNHGFYNYHPVLFRDLAYANNYEWDFMWIGDHTGWYKSFNPEAEVCREVKRTRPYSLFEQVNPRRPKKYSEIEDFIYRKMRKKGHASIVVAYRKIAETPFKFPLQGKWIHNINVNSVRSELSEYAKQKDTFYDYHS